MSVESTMHVARESSESLRSAIDHTNAAISAVGHAMGLIAANEDKGGPIVAGVEASSLRQGELTQVMREIDAIAAGLEAYASDLSVIQARMVTDPTPRTTAKSAIATAATPLRSEGRGGSISSAIAAAIASADQD
jgi:hypothetical protein